MHLRKQPFKLDMEKQIGSKLEKEYLKVVYCHPAYLTYMKQIWKTQQWPQDWKRSVFIPIPKKHNAKECSNYCTTVLISHASKVMLKILQDKLQKYVNQEF